MKSETSRYLIGFLLAVGLIVVVIVLLVRSLVSSPSTSSKQTTPAPFSAYATTGTTVRLTVDTPIVAPKKHHDVIITVGKSKTTFKIAEGYNGKIVRSRSYPMTVTSYQTFLKAIALNGFTNGSTDPENQDERGRCALGDRFIYEVIDPNGKTTQRFWGSTCGMGTFNGDGGIVRRLFRSQVPDYFSLTRDIQF